MTRYASEDDIPKALRERNAEKLGLERNESDSDGFLGYAAQWKQGEAAKAAQSDSESKIQQKLVGVYDDWNRAQRWRYPWLVAVPNGADVSDGNRMRLVAEGLRSGFPDLIMPAPSDIFYGLALELKHPDRAKLRDSQACWFDRLRDYGWRCEMVTSVDQGLAIISDYLGVRI
jgi:hypothetical protein